MSERSDDDFLADILEAVRRIGIYTDGMRYERFLEDEKTQDAVIRNLEIVGEATKGISSQLRQENPGVPWKGMSEVRDRLIHGYFGVNLDIVWSIIRDELPTLETQIAGILNTFENEK